jgi:hypothetical protein
MRERIGKYLSVERCEPKPGCKTYAWTVYGEDEMDLGRVSWYGPFRKYSFWPNPRTVFETVCLSDIVHFLESVKALRVPETKEVPV